MKKEIDKLKPSTVNMLLNPKMFNGRNEGRTGPLLLVLILIFSPLVLFGSTLINIMIAYGIRSVLRVFLPIYIFYSWKVVARLLLREKARVERFKRDKLKKYTDVDEISQIRKIHNDGCVEYLDGSVSYFMICKNGNKSDALVKAHDLEKFFNSISEYSLNIHILNMADTSTLSNRYKKLVAFEDKSIARDMMEIIDFNRRYVENNSLVTITVFEITGKQYDKPSIKLVLQNAVLNLNRKTYREAFVANKTEASYILNRTLQ